MSTIWLMDKNIDESGKRKILSKTTLTVVVFPLLFLLSIVFSFWLLFSHIIYPGISIAHTNVTALTPELAKKKVTDSINKRLQEPLIFTAKNATGTGQQTYKIALAGNLYFHVDEAVNEAMKYGHKQFYTNFTNIPLKATFTPSLENQIHVIATSIDQPAIDAEIEVTENQITVSPSQEGMIVDRDALNNIIITYINTGSLSSAVIPVKKSYPRLSYTTALEIKKRLDEIKSHPLKLVYKDRSYTLDLSTLLSLIDLTNTLPSLFSTNMSGEAFNISSLTVGKEEISDTKLSLNQEKTKEYLKSIAQEIDQPVIEPLFTFDPSVSGNTKVKEFKPPQEGRTLNIDKAFHQLAQGVVTHGQVTIELPVDTIQPKNSLTNDLGIKELIGRGESHFAGSIANRIFNVGHGAQKINGILVPPEEVFSFNKTVGDITAATGFKQAYVIKSGRTVLDDGGGICQVSTTLYRAVLNSGLPVVQRTAHAYRVSYYEQGYPPGLDATIYYPSVDFQFKNDTDRHILIQTTIEGTSMTVDLYGTSDGRVVNMTTPKILSQTPPLPEIRQDDPTLPRGTVKQVDWSAWGAKVVFTRTVTRGGETIINETVNSNFRPWQAVYLVGTKDG